MKKKTTKSSHLGMSKGIYSLVDTVKFAETDGDSVNVSEVQIFPDGIVFHPDEPDEPFKFNHEFRQGMINSMNESGIQPMVDFNHQSGYALDQKSGEAAGFVTELHDRGEDGLWGTVEWNENGLKAVRGKQYKYLSPEWSVGQWSKDSGEYIEYSPRLYAIALTNRPFLEGKLTPVQATDVVNEKENNSMSENVQTMIDTEAETEEVEIVEENTEVTEVATENTVEELQAKLDQAEAKANAAIEALKASYHSEANGLITKAVVDGKVTPAMRPSIEQMSETLAVEGSNGIEKLKVFLATLQTQTHNEPEGESLGGNETITMNDTDRKVCKMLGMSEELFLKHADVKAVTNDGKAITFDGRIRELK